MRPHQYEGTARDVGEHEGSIPSYVRSPLGQAAWLDSACEYGWMIFAARSVATWSSLMPSQSLSTSALCWPSSGAGFTGAVLPLKRTAQPAILNGPLVGCWMVW